MPKTSTTSGHSESAASPWCPITDCPLVHDPSFSYFGSVYMTLLSVVQGVIFSILAVPFAMALFGLNPDWVVFVPVFAFGVTLWHKYVNHHQLLGWQLTPKDTLLVVSFGFVQSLAATVAISLVNGSVTNVIFKIGPMNCILGVIALGLTTGIVAYAHSGARALDRSVECVINKRCGDQDGSRIYKVMVGFEVVCVQAAGKAALGLGVVFVVGVIANHWLTRIPEWLRWTALSVADTIVLARFVLRFDLSRYLASREAEAELILYGRQLIERRDEFATWRNWLWLAVRQPPPLPVPRQN